MNKSLTIGLCVIVAIAFVILAVVYWTHSANQLPHWIPGYNAADTAPHIKHGIAAVVLAVAALTLAWFQSGPKPAANSTQE